MKIYQGLQHFHNVKLNNIFIYKSWIFNLTKHFSL